MYILTWIYDTPDIPEYHNIAGTLTQHMRSNAINAYAKRKNDARYVSLRIEYYENGSYSNITHIINEILDKRG